MLRYRLGTVNVRETMPLISNNDKHPVIEEIS